jgi:2,3-dihydroxybenzoate decarboxylase
MPHPQVIAIEEHYLDPDVDAAYGNPPVPLRDRLLDTGARRLADMDAAGIDMQVLSLAPPGLQLVPAGKAADLARRANDRLAEIVAAAPTRFAAFAAVPTADFAAAPGELERAVRDLGFRGAMLHGLTAGGIFPDDRRLWPLYERAAALRVPVYLHPPANPHPAVREAYYGAYADSHPMFTRAAWGYAMETGTQAIRLVLSGLFEAVPDLTIVLGHLGEGLPFFLARTDEALSRDTPMKTFAEVFRRHFYVTTSGFFSTPALACCIAELGIERVLFSVDWPFAGNKPAMDWSRRLALPPEQMALLLHGNARRLLGL